MGASKTTQNNFLIDKENKEILKFLLIDADMMRASIAVNIKDMQIENKEAEIQFQLEFFLEQQKQLRSDAIENQNFILFMQNESAYVYALETAKEFKDFLSSNEDLVQDQCAVDRNVLVGFEKLCDTFKPYQNLNYMLAELKEGVKILRKKFFQLKNRSELLATQQKSNTVLDNDIMMLGSALEMFEECKIRIETELKNPVSAVTDSVVQKCCGEINLVKSTYLDPLLKSKRNKGFFCEIKDWLHQFFYSSCFKSIMNPLGTRVYVSEAVEKLSSIDRYSAFVSPEEPSIVGSSTVTFFSAEKSPIVATSTVGGSLTKTDSLSP